VSDRPPIGDTRVGLRRETATPAVKRAFRVQPAAVAGRCGDTLDREPSLYRDRHWAFTDAAVEPGQPCPELAELIGSPARSVAPRADTAAMPSAHVDGDERRARREQIGTYEHVRPAALGRLKAPAPCPPVRRQAAGAQAVGARVQ